MKRIFRKTRTVFCLVALALILSCGFMLVPNADRVRANAAGSEDYTFRLINNDTEYSIGALNKNMTVAVIPDTYNGLPVTAITNNGFMACRQLMKVYLPRSVKTIGLAAFMNCANLEKVYMSELISIGQQAFALCPKLDTMVLPASIGEMGATVLPTNTSSESTVIVRGTEDQRAQWNARWAANFKGNIYYDTTLLATYDIEDENGTVVGLGIDGGQYIDAPNEILEIDKNEESGLPFLEIADMAFSGGQIKSIVVTAAHEVKIGAYAFAGLMAESVVLNDNVKFETANIYDGPMEDIGTPISLFAASSIQSVTLPATINTIYNCMFDSCANLTEIKFTDNTIPVNTLPQTVTRIAESAFRFCSALSIDEPILKIPVSVTTVNNFAFEGWNASQKIGLDFDSIPEGWAAKWKGDAGDPQIVYNVPDMAVSFKTYTNETFNAVLISYNSIDYNFPIPTRNGYTFTGWYDGENGTGKQYAGSDGKFVCAWDKKSDTVLYARWIANTYAVVYELNGGSNGNNPSEYTTGSSIRLDTPTRCGYIFEGWFRDMEFTHVAYGIDTDDYDDITFYAKWREDIYEIFYELNGGKNHADNPDSYTVNDKVILKAPIRDGYEFAGWYENKDLTIPSLGGFEIGTTQNKTYYAAWTIIEYSISYANDGERNENPNKYTIEQTIVLNIPERAGYTFEGWYKDNAFTERVLQIGPKETGNMTLYAKWSPNWYTITYMNVENSQNNNPSMYNSDQEINLRDVFRDGFIFGGWFWDENLTERFSGTAAGVYYGGDLTFYGLWYEYYTITFIPNNGQPEFYHEYAYDTRFLQPYGMQLPSLSRNGFNGYWVINETKYDFHDYYANFRGNETVIAEWTPKSYEEMLLYGGHIYCKEQFLEFAEGIKKGKYESNHVYLEADINLYGVDWVPISFKGRFYGNNHIIFNIYIDLSLDGIGYGFFRDLGVSSQVHDLTLQQIRVKNFDSSKNSYTIGGLAATALSGSQITNCHVFDIDIKIDHGYLGGMFGNSYGTVKKCSVREAKLECKNNIGGLAAYTKGTVQDCAFMGSIYAYCDGVGGGANYGGISGLNGGELVNCTVESGSFISYESPVQNDKDIRDKIRPCIGKLIGLNSGTYTKCKAVLSIYGRDKLTSYTVAFKSYDQAEFVFAKEDWNNDAAGLVGQQE